MARAESNDCGETVAEAARQYDADVVDMVEYLRDAIADIDKLVTEWAVKRQMLAVKLAAIDASSDRRVQDAAAEYEERIATGRPYEGAEDAQDLLTEAHRRHGL